MPAAMPQTSDEPYCSHCGYALSGLTESSKCPECGRPLVEVLARRSAMFGRGRRYRSKTTLFGWPLIDIAMGPHGSEMRGKARGIIALGDVAVGGIAFGGVSCGIVSFGGLATGLFAFGGLGLGLLAGAGGLGTGLLAAGGGAAGGLALGGGAIGYAAQGGAAVGVYARGGSAYGIHTQDFSSPPTQIVIDMFDRFSWFFGAWPPQGMTSGWQAAAAILGSALVVAALIAIVVLILWRREHELEQQPQVESFPSRRHGS